MGEAAAGSHSIGPSSSVGNSSSVSGVTGLSTNGVVTGEACVDSIGAVSSANADGTDADNTGVGGAIEEDADIGKHPEGSDDTSRAGARDANDAVGTDVAGVGSVMSVDGGAAAAAADSSDTGGVGVDTCESVGSDVAYRRLRCLSNSAKIPWPGFEANVICSPMSSGSPCLLLIL